MLVVLKLTDYTHSLIIFSMGYALILLNFNRSLQKQRAK